MLSQLLSVHRAAEQLALLCLALRSVAGLAAAVEVKVKTAPTDRPTDRRRQFAGIKLYDPLFPIFRGFVNDIGEYRMKSGLIQQRGKLTESSPKH